MPARDKTSFVSSLPDFLLKANMQGAAQAYYSFVPVSGQSSYEFLFNDLLTTGKMFIGPVQSVTISQPGSGYFTGEVPTVTFTSLDAGTGVAGTAVMGDIGGGPSAMDSTNLAASYQFTPSEPFYGGSPSLIPSGNFATANVPAWKFLDYTTLTLGTYKNFQVIDQELRVRYCATGTGYSLPWLYSFNSGLNTSGDNFGYRWYFISTSVTKAHEILNSTGYTQTPQLLLGLIVPNKFKSSSSTLSWATGLYEAAGTTASGDLYINKNGVTLANVTGGRAVVYSGTRTEFLAGRAYPLYSSSRDIYGPWAATGSGAGSFTATTVINGNINYFSVDIYKTGIQKFGVYVGGGVGSSTRTSPLFLTFITPRPSHLSGTSGDYYTVNNLTGWSDFSLGSDNYSGELHWNSLNGTAGASVLGNLDFFPTSSGENFKAKEGLTGGLALWNNFPYSENSPALARASTCFRNTNGTGPDFSQEDSLAFWFQTPTIGTETQRLLSFYDSWISLSNLGALIYQNLQLTWNGYTPSPQVTTIATAPFITTGEWYYITARRSKPNNKLYLSYSGYSGGILSEHSANIPAAGTSAGNTGLIIHQVVGSDYLIDDLRVWNKYVDPKVSAVSVYGVSGVTITASGDSYNTPPTITITAPTGGGDAAVAYANLDLSAHKIYADSLPALSVGGSNFIVTGLTSASGTGRFYPSNNDFLRLGNNIPCDDWTAFINFAPTGNYTGVSEILLSTMDYVNQQSGLMVGINDSHRLFVEYIDTTHSIGGARRIRVHNQELSANNLVAISADSIHSTVTFHNYNIARQDSYALTYNVPGYRPCNTMYLGGFPNTGNSTQYTGFIGKMMDFMLLSGAANPVQIEAVSPSFFVTGYSPSQEVPVYTYYSIVTGAKLIYQVVATGVTGYGLNSVSIPDKDGSNITVYDFVARTGEIYGSGVSYLTGETSGINITYSGTQEQFYYNHPYIRNYADSNFVMLAYPISSGDVLEVRAFAEKWVNKISVIPDAFNLYDFYLSDGYTSNTVNVYNDGLLQVTGIDYVLTSGKIVSNSMAGYQSLYSYLLYDEISGTTVVSGWTGWNGSATIGNNPTQGGTLDVFLNGQKLISGFDYQIDASRNLILTGIQLGNSVSWASGTFAFAPARTDTFYSSFVSGVGYWNDFTATVGNLMDEMVYLNGQRLVPGVDYKTIPPFSMLNSDLRPSSQGFVLYSGDIMPLSILATRPNITTGLGGGDSLITDAPISPLY